MNHKISLPGRWLSLIWLALLVLLPLLGYCLEYWNYQYGGNDGWRVELAQFFNPTRERNLPTYLQCCLLTAIALGCWLQSKVRDNEGQDSRFGYQCLAVFSLLLAVDECSALHERLTVPLQKLIHSDSLLFFAWIPVGMVVACAGLIFSWSALREMEDDTRLLVWGGWAVYFLSAIGMKLVLGPAYRSYGSSSLTYLGLCLLEEAGEWLGAGLVCRGIWRQLVGKKGLEIEWQS